jgi:hypothetical protein
MKFQFAIKRGQFIVREIMVRIAILLSWLSAPNQKHKYCTVITRLEIKQFVCKWIIMFAF